MLTRPKITEEVLKQIRQTIKANPEWNRTRISKYLCELWDWRVPGGQIKDISCRDMLRALDKVGEIQLPESKYSHEKRHWRKPKQINHESKPITCALSKLQPLIVEVIEGGTALAGFKSLIDQYHYLGFGRTVGENMKYMIRGKDGAPLACLLFGSAAWKCRDRDAYIGWDRGTERREVDDADKQHKILNLALGNDSSSGQSCFVDCDAAAQRGLADEVWTPDHSLGDVCGIRTFPWNLL